MEEGRRKAGGREAQLKGDFGGIVSVCGVVVVWIGGFVSDVFWRFLGWSLDQAMTREDVFHRWAQG